jgi:hypothetical protein
MKVFVPGSSVELARVVGSCAMEERICVAACSLCGATGCKDDVCSVSCFSGPPDCRVDAAGPTLRDRADSCDTAAPRPGRLPKPLSRDGEIATAVPVVDAEICSSCSPIVSLVVDALAEPSGSPADDGALIEVDSSMEVREGVALLLLPAGRAVAGDIESEPTDVCVDLMLEWGSVDLGNTISLAAVSATGGGPRKMCVHCSIAASPGK